MVLLGGAGLGFFYFKLNGNLKTVDIDQALGTDRPQNVDNGSMDILVLGSDSRGGANGEYGQDDGGSARSDTAMIIHLYEGHEKASVVSIPRDTMISRPSCATSGGKTDPGVSAPSSTRRSPSAGPPARSRPSRRCRGSAWITT